MILRSMRYLLAGFLPYSLMLVGPVAKADSLSIVYTSAQDQTDVASTGFSSVVFTGFVVNNTDAPITFQLSYVLGPPSSFYVASLVQGIGFPGITLAGGESTPVFDLATVTINPFDQSLAYPGVVSFSLDAIALPTGGLITESADTVTVVTGVPEASTFTLGVLALLAGYLAMRIRLRNQRLAGTDRENESGLDKAVPQGLKP
ncbi:MAG TPA: hypothetical protein VNH19_06840 [Candidatus Limnocylindrales bacterium]|nr:hypothetical protein [Candidatus Limnocylindrales bacterium]